MSSNGANNSNSGGNSNASSSGHRNSNSSSSGLSFPTFSLRNFLMQTRAGRSSYAGRMCDLERGSSSNSGTCGGNNKADKSHASSSHGASNTGKVSVRIQVKYHAILEKNRIKSDASL